MSIQISGIVLAKGAPNRTQDGRTTMCSIVLSDELGLIRLYPLSVTENQDVKVWTRIRCTVMRSQKDNRTEAFRLVGNEIEVLDRIESSSSKSSILDSCHLKSGDKDPIDYQNDRKASICVVKAHGRIGISMKSRDETERRNSEDEDYWVMTQSEFPYKPYVSWTSYQGKTHETHLVAQEVYLGMQKNAANPSRVFDNMHALDPDYQHWMVLGNTKDRRNVWVMPHLHRLKKTSFVTTTSFLTNDGESGSWPYSQQEEINAKYVSPQMQFNFTT